MKAGDLVILLCCAQDITVPLSRAKEQKDRESKKEQEFVHPTWDHRSHDRRGRLSSLSIADLWALPPLLGYWQLDTPLPFKPELEGLF